MEDYPENDDEDPDDDDWKPAAKDKNNIDNVEDDEFGGYKNDESSSYEGIVLPD